jgi:hypothetical protein
MYSTKTAAANFAHTLCQKKPKAHLPRFMGHLAGVLEAYVAAQAAGKVGVDLARQADGALYAVGALVNVLKAKVRKNGVVLVQLLHGFKWIADISCRLVWSSVWSSPVGHRSCMHRVWNAPEGRSREMLGGWVPAN